MASRSHVMVCTCTNCISAGALKIKQAFEREIEKNDLSNEVRVVQTGASGLCVNGPIVVIKPDDIYYPKLDEAQIPKLVEEHLLKGRPVEKFMYEPPDAKGPVPRIRDIAFFKNQRLVALRNRGVIDPENIDEYISRDGYKALATILQDFTPEEVIEEISESGLRGRGGGGFPTGTKWGMGRKELLKARKKDPDAPGYIICNADEGDPGAFMDRSVIEADPHSVIEGMAIGAYAIGGREGYVYVRAEYPLAIKRMRIAIDQAREYGILGDDIFGFDFSFDIRIFEGAGAFICGEETSLVRSIEEHVPQPEQKPPYPSVEGLWGYPTNINNVETWANVPVIINWGADWFSELGTKNSAGTKVFSLAGNVKNAGLVEVPMGISLREMIYEIGGGIAGDKNIKAVQMGGPSGGFVPKDMLHLAVDYESLKEAGAIMGSGGMVVMDEETCMVDIAKYFIRFGADESCGRCSSCRDGAYVVLNILERITSGEGKLEDLDFIEELSVAIKEASMCGLGQTLPNAPLTALKHFREEFEKHIVDKTCPAGICKELIKYTIDPDNCTGCTICAQNCLSEAISGEAGELHVIDQEKCTKCNACYEVCNFAAVIRK